jgi:hypothetical protein
MTRQLELIDLEALQPNPDNPKAHNLDMLGKSVDHFGYVEPVVIDERTGWLISGHGRREHLLAEWAKGHQPPDGIVAEDGRWMVPVIRGWSSRSDAEARTILIALNRTGELGGWNNEHLLSMLQVVSADDLLGLSGFSAADLNRLAVKMANRSDGSALANAGRVIMGEPVHSTQPSDHWRLGGRHHLVVADVMRQWSLYTGLLQGDALLVPYPGPYAALSLVAERSPLVLVHPEPFVAGHILDRYAAANGEQSITKENSHGSHHHS